MKTLTNQQCRTLVNHHRDELLYNTIVCAQSVENEDSCTDSGSPLISDDHLIGLALWNTPQDQSQIFEFIRIAPFYSWIKQYINESEHF